MKHAEQESTKIKAVLTFWFDEITPEYWFKKDAEFDAVLKERFGTEVERGLAGQLENWTHEKDGQLALILLLDQMTRNIFRDTPKAFAGDPTACALSVQAEQDGLIAAETIKAKRQFYLMPMMHAEDIAVQKASLPLFKAYTSEQTYDYAVRHHDIIERFGRFPHRNDILNRPSTKEERAFLQEPHSSF